jgi:Transposase DDE domain/Transposase domain (DUF772)
VTLGLAPRQSDLFRSTAGFCDRRVAPDSIYGLLHRECHRLFPDEMFADLFTDVGRRSVPPMIVAVVMVLQRLEGCSDREAVDRFCFDARWKYAAGGLDFDYPGFVHTVLVDMRARLARSDSPDRIFDRVLLVARSAGLVGRRRVLDSTPLYDSVATMDTVTLVRSAIRGLLKAAGGELEPQLRAVLTRQDDYATAGKPVCDYDDPDARAALVDALATDGMGLLGALEGRELPAALAQAVALLATVLGQDLDRDAAGVFRTARRVAKDRVISTVDPQARHGRKTGSRGFDGYKGHVGVDPDSEIVTATAVTAGNAGDGSVASELIADLAGAAADTSADRPAPTPEPASTDVGYADRDSADVGRSGPDGGQGPDGDQGTACVYGDNAYGTGSFHDLLQRSGIESKCKTQQPVAPGGLFPKDRFDIDLHADTVTCPAGRTMPIRRDAAGTGVASFGTNCTGCPLRQQCTTATAGRRVRVGRHERQLAAARARQRDPEWVADYRATRPKVERKLGHLMRRRHGGRRARVRGSTKIAADFALLAAAVNLARLGVLAVASTSDGSWAVALR